MQTVPTTIRIQPSLLERLKMFAREHNTTMTDVIEAGIRHIIEQQEQARLDRMYQGLFALKGMIKEPITNASATIDEELYGEHGAWKGIRE
jgi:predicted transcriptional regulator